MPASYNARQARFGRRDPANVDERGGMLRVYWTRFMSLAQQDDCEVDEG